MEQPVVSIIIRTKNEEKWIGSCLSSVFDQEFKGFEVIVVDDNSTDSTLDIVKGFDVNLIKFQQEYLPGLALNAGIRESQGKYIVCLSGHCVPVDKGWLGALIAPMDEDDTIAGVYGRQQPLPYSSPRDKRDLLTIFGLDRKIQRRDSYFHNANSALRRELWEKFPFSEETTNIEDRIWAKEVLDDGYCLAYEPDASVYHWHGVHQNDDVERCENVVRILESLDLIEGDVQVAEKHFSGDVCAVIPIRGLTREYGGKPLLSYTIRQALEAELVDRVLVVADNEETAELAVKYGAEAPFIRPQNFSHDFVGLNMVMKYTREKLIEAGEEPTVMLMMKEVMPFRSQGLVDSLLREKLYQAVDTLIPAYAEYKNCFKKVNGGYELLDERQMPRTLKEPVYVSLAGLGLAFDTQNLDDDRMMGNKVGIHLVESFESRIEVNNVSEKETIEFLLDRFWS